MTFARQGRSWLVVNKKIVLKVFLSVIALLSALSIFIAFKSSFKPSFYGFLLGFLVSIILVSIFLYDIYCLGDNYFKSFKKNGSFTKIYILLIHFFSYMCFGVYLVADFSNAIISNEKIVEKYVIPIGEKGRRQSLCNYSIAIFQDKKLTGRWDYCISKKEFLKLLSVKPVQGSPNVRLVGMSSNTSVLGSKIVKFVF